MAGFDGLDSRFASALQQMISDSGGRMWIVSGYRSVEEQQSLWDAALAKYGSSDAARQWVAPPGSSNHNKGLAVDLGFSDGGLDWAHQNAGRYGLQFPMEWEDWHIEPMGVRDGTYTSSTGGGSGSPDAYTDPPAGMQAVADPNQNFDLATQLQRAMGFILNPPAAEATGPERTHPEIYS